MKTALLITITFFIGFTTNKILNPVKSVETKEVPTLKTPPQCNSLAEAKTNLISISQNEYFEYTQIKDLKQKYEKADELLGKIMLLFLADVGFRVQKTSAPLPEPKIEPLTKEPLPPKPDLQNVKSPESESINVGEKKFDLSGKSSRIKFLNTQKQIFDTLNKSLIADPKNEFSKANYPAQAQVKFLEGLFSGYIHFFDKKREELNVSWELIPDYSKNPILGRFILKISGAGKNSETSGQGQFKNINTLADDPNAIIVEACGDGCYMQLYYNAPFDQFFGNYYERNRNTKIFERVGLIDLRK